MKYSSVCVIVRASLFSILLFWYLQKVAKNRENSREMVEFVLESAHPKNQNIKREIYLF